MHQFLFPSSTAFDMNNKEKNWFSVLWRSVFPTKKDLLNETSFSNRLATVKCRGISEEPFKVYWWTNCTIDWYQLYVQFPIQIRLIALEWHSFKMILGREEREPCQGKLRQRKFTSGLCFPFLWHPYWLPIYLFLEESSENVKAVWIFLVLLP